MAKHKEVIEYDARKTLGKQMARWAGQDPIGVVATALESGRLPADPRRVRMALAYLKAERKDPRSGTTTGDLQELTSMIEHLAAYL